MNRDTKRCQCCNEKTNDLELSLWGLCADCQGACDRFLIMRRELMRRRVNVAK